MKKQIAIFFALAMLAIAAHAQDVKSQLPPQGGVTAQQLDTLKQQIISQVFHSPALYNDAYAKFLSSYQSDSSQFFKFMRALNIKFLTFQATQQQQPSLGMQYNYQNAWTKSKTTATMSSFQSYTLNFSGNVAYKKTNNPANLLQSNFTYNASFLWGGKVKPLDSASKVAFARLQAAQVQASIAQNTALMQQLYLQRASFIHTTNQFYAGINGMFNYETNQDFSRRQFVPGVLINIGAKAWDPKQALLYFNIPDYPFALIRLLTGTDKKFTLSGASFPSALVGIDHVIPDQDSLRQAVAGNLNPYNRFRTEVAFKTAFARVSAAQMIYFSADFRYYRELNASASITNAGMNRYVYFAAALESTSGFFASYSIGKLPFDQRNANVFGLGFHYSFGNGVKN